MSELLSEMPAAQVLSREDVIRNLLDSGEAKVIAYIVNSPIRLDVKGDKDNTGIDGDEASYCLIRMGFVQDMKSGLYVVNS
jgi:hypothetical protein